MRTSRLVLLLWMMFASVANAASTVEQEVAYRLDQIRAIRAQYDPKSLEESNRRMDDAWKFFSANMARAVPVIRAQLVKELKQPRPNDLLLLDAGLFLYSNDGVAGKAVASQALFALNPDAGIVRANDRELFDFASALARNHDSRVLPLIAKAFLGRDDTIFVPQHSLSLNSTLICSFLYGQYGPDSETYLRAQLADKRLAQRTIEVLIWTGSPAGIPEIKAAFAANPSEQLFSRVTAFMMQAGGPAGRAYMLSLDPKTLPANSRVYLAKVRDAIVKSSFQSIRGGFLGIPGDARLSDGEVKLRLAAMIKNDGKDDRTSPLAILDSKLPADFLIGQLVQVRTRSFYRLSDEALSDIEITNALINGLRYR